MTLSRLQTILKTIALNGAILKTIALNGFRAIFQIENSLYRQVL